MPQPHKHAAVIKAWADGAEIECRRLCEAWIPTERPQWSLDMQYRVKHKWQKEMDAYAAGKIIQFRDNARPWAATSLPHWFTYEGAEYRIKPEPVVQLFHFDEWAHARCTIHERGNLMLTFEDGVLIAAEVLK